MLSVLLLLKCFKEEIYFHFWNSYNYYYYYYY